jgi:VIT1/CCC1 family predicted Fe2+/Mn2+ transporter
MSAVQKVTQIGGKQLSMTPSAVAARNKRAAIKQASSAAYQEKLQAKAVAAQKKNVAQFCAALAAGFLPIASYVLAHFESKTNPMLWLLVGAALLFSAPTLASWAQKWCGNQYKAWGFTILLEGVMVCSHTEVLSYAGLTILVLINATNAWTLAAANGRKGTK